jgi:hypothetical protein
VSRSTRASIASSLLALALSLLGAGCGESNTHSAGDVQRALARHGVATERFSTEPPREVRTQVAAASLRIGLILSYYGARLAGLAERKTPRVNLVATGPSIVVAKDSQDARWWAHWLRFPRTPRVVDNIVVYGGGPRVDAALADLR